MKYVEMNLIRPTAAREGIKDHVVLEEIPNDCFVEKRGNIGIKVGRQKERRSEPKPMMLWDETITRYSDKGYQIVPGKKSPGERKRFTKFSGSDENFKPEETRAAEELVTLLRNMAKKAIEEAFTVNLTVESLSKEQMAEGKKILDALADIYESTDTKTFNQNLCEYYAMIPRRMQYLADFLARGKDRRGRRLSEEAAIKERAGILQKEQEFFKMLIDIMEDKTIEANKSASETYGLTIRAVTEDEEKWIKKKLGSLSGQYSRAWRITNQKTEQQFRNFCEKEGLSEKNGIDHLFHGSRGENFWSIIKSGLTVSPKDVVITGKAYGQGTYFAPNAQKSSGYTDHVGAKWTGGTAKSGYMGIYKVATGKRYNGDRGCDTTLNWEKLQRICPGAHCTWAEPRSSGFRMTEVIVYQDCQSTVEYLIELE